VLRACRILGAAVLAAFAVVTLTPVPTYLALRYAAEPRLGPANAIVVLGGGLVKGSLADASIRRAVEGIRLLRLGLAPVILFTGEPSADGPSEPEVRAQLARELGVPPDAILTATANTTREEARAAAALLQPRGARTVLLVTGALHLVRAQGTFERVGFEVLPAPAEPAVTVGEGAAERFMMARQLVHEAVARGYYRLAGYL
jgi:uncharacterized SAM-binding protein YcdF (DUF218 family)